MNVAEVEKKGLPAVLEVHIGTGVAKGIIDQRRAVNHFFLCLGADPGAEGFLFGLEMLRL